MDSLPARWLAPELEISLYKSVSSRLLPVEDIPGIAVLKLDGFKHFKPMIPYLHESELKHVRQYSHMQGAIRHAAGCIAAKIAACGYLYSLNRETSHSEKPAPPALPLSNFRVSNETSGYPYISGLEGGEPVSVSISHSRSFAAGAAWRSRLGIDVEEPLRATEDVWRRVLGKVYGDAVEWVSELLDDQEPSSRREVAAKLWVAQECAYKILGAQPARIESFRYEPSEEIIEDQCEMILLRVNKRVMKIVTVSWEDAVIGLGADITEIL